MTDKKVLRLIKNNKSKPSRKRAVHKGCLEFMKMVMHDVKKGHIQSIFVVGTTDDGLVYSGWSPQEDVFTMLGGIENAKLEYAEKEIERR